MTLELPPIVLEGKDLRKYRKLNRKYPVSREFLHRNWENAKRFISYALQPRCVIRNYAWRKRGNRVVIIRRPRILLFDPRLKGMIKRRKANVKQWSPSIVRLYKKMGYVTEYEETELYGEELSKQMKQQLELLKNGKRGISLIEDANKNVELRLDKEYSAIEQREEEQKIEDVLSAATQPTSEKDTAEDAEKTLETKVELEAKPIDEKPPTSEPIVIEESDGQSNSEAAKATEKVPEKSGGSKFLDMLMNKVRVKNFAKESNIPTVATSSTSEATCSKDIAEEGGGFNFNDDASDDFVGFDESAHQPGMLLTPLVPQSCKTLDGNAAFVSDALEAYMKKNNLRESGLEDRERLLEPMYQDGRVTAHCMPPHMDMPAVPDSLQRLRTVADRRLYLQRCKSQKMAIINNEANIYRELQRKQRQRKVKVTAMQHLQSSGSQMPFTRQGWQAASYVATDMDKYYYQVIRIDGEMVRLPGSRGNNSQREKRPHRSHLTAQEIAGIRCNRSCVDATLSNELKVLPTWPLKGGKLQKLNQYPLPAIFKPCPLSQKPFQKPLDDDTAALLLAGGSMAIVSMPTVQLDVKPQLGRPLDEIAKRYLQYILPHHDITREWAEFSVSTLQVSPNSMRAAEEQAAEAAQAAETPAGRRKSFTFVIPYLNDRNHILVRRVVDRSEQLDDSFTAEQPPEKLQEFQFRKELTETPDPVELACADMINDMINTVAISCSENSFVSIDPDASSCAISEISPIKEEAAPGKVDKSGSKLATNKQAQHQLRRPNKQQRLAKELRRLNATIIDAAAMAKDANKPCVKEHCQMGCLCESLAGEFPARKHCGRADCVLECRCTRAELTRIMRVETDGRGISNEDAFNLRRQATARLAKMEKDFTSTLVLTDNETLLINETQCDKKRRCTKAPKRYEDFDDSIEDDDLVRPSKAAKRDREAITKRSRVSPDTSAFPTLPTLGPVCFVKDTDFVQLKHCEVSLRRLPDVGNLATFCMTHQLYNCFCGGTAMEGKPVIIEKEDADAAITPHYVPELATRAHYSFERPQEEPQSKKRRKDNKSQSQSQEQLKMPNTKAPAKILPKLEPVAPKTPATKPAVPSSKPSKSSLVTELFPPPAPSAAAKTTVTGVESPQRPAELDIIFSYYRSRPYLCRRAVSVPKNCYLRLNRRRAERMNLEVSRSETPQTQELLRKRISNAVHYYRAELDQQRRLEQEQLKKQKKVTDLESMPHIIVVRDDSDESEAGNGRSLIGNDFSVDVQPTKRKRQLPHLPDEPKEKKKEQQPDVQPAPMPDIQMPKISSCYSLYSGTVEPAAASMPASTSFDDSASVDSAVFRASYNDVILKMNTHVSKKMQDIDLALQRESKIIPSPNEDILCIIKWTNFLAAFESDYVFIWDVQMKNYSFLAATITNMMPAVCGAIAVVNTRFAPDTSALPLMARMLLESKRNENTGRLAVVMQGRQQYWLVKGFLRYMEGNACTKPTPQSHPILTKKINVLCSLMVKQKIREQHKQLELAKASKEATNLPQSSNATTPPQDIAVSTPTPPSTALPAAILPTPSPRSSTTHSKDAGLIIRSNIEFRKVHQGDVSALQIPERHAKDHRWLVLNLYDDFSHIFVPAFRDMISLDRIYQVVRVSHESQKVIKLQFFKDAPYDAFVTPASKRKIYFGPLPLDKEPPVLVLLQSVDGKMMLREVYQREHNIKVQTERRTMAFWVLQINNQVHFEIDLTASAGMVTKVEKTESEQQLQQQQLAQLNAKDGDDEQDDADDDDCMIIDDDEDADGGADANAKKSESSRETQPQRTNFTIQALPSSNGGALQIVLAPPNAADGDSGSNGSVAGGFLPFIANVPATGRTAPSTQFLTPQVQVTQTPVMPTTSGRSDRETDTADPKPAKISRISVQRCKPTPASASTTTTSPTNGKEIGSHPAKINETLQQLLSGGNGNIKIGTATAGVTITKMKAKEDLRTAQSHTPQTNIAAEPIKIGLKRKAATEPSMGSSGNAPTIVKQTPTTISIGNLPIHQVRPMPTKLQQLAAARKSLPHKQPAAKEARPRTSLPAKHSVAETPPMSSSSSTPDVSSRKGPSTSTPGKAQYGFLVAKDLPRYRVKLVDSKYMVKIPSDGLYAFRSCAAASVYLNR
ncbi:hypothetical protein KR044_007454 [Drosophila immigrans]|nr:hypothetical protein KR044_007454 [Drosophila immigrans]